VHKTIMMITPTNDLVVTEEPALVTSSNDSSS